MSLNHVLSSISERIKSFGPSLLVLISTCSATCFQKSMASLHTETRVRYPPYSSYSFTNLRPTSSTFYTSSTYKMCAVYHSLKIERRYVSILLQIPQQSCTANCKPGIVENQNYFDESVVARPTIVHSRKTSKMNHVVSHESFSLWFFFSQCICQNQQIDTSTAPFNPRVNFIL